MSKLIFAGVFVLFSLNAFGQGQLVFSNAIPTRITNAVTGVAAAPGTFGTQVGLYIGNVGANPSSLTLVAQTNCYTGGLFNGGVRTLAGWGAGSVQLQVRAWLASTIYPSYEAAMAAQLGGDASVLGGVSDPFGFVLTQGPDTPQSIAIGGLTPIMLTPVPIPEPSAIALGAISLGILVMFRRRK